jgi:chromosome segregation ATPase
MTVDKKFKLQFDEDTTETNIIKTEIEDLKIEKLSHRITLIAILIPILIVVILTIAYIDIKRRVIKTQDRGTIGVQTLTENLESRFSSLSLRQAQLEETFEKKSTGLDKSTAAVSVRMKKLEDSLKKIQSDKVGKSEVAKSFAKIDKAVKSTTKSIASLTTKQDSVQDKLAAQQKEFAAKLDKIIAAKLEKIEINLVETENSIQELQDEVSALSTGKIDKNQLDFAIKLEAMRSQEALKQSSEEMELKLAKLQKRVDELAKQIKDALAKQVSSKAAQKKAAPKKPTVQKNESATTNQIRRGTTTPKPGDILEQNLD